VTGQKMALKDILKSEAGICDEKKEKHGFTVKQIWKGIGCKVMYMTNAFLIYF
jgi:hypothetical protein